MGRILFFLVALIAVALAVLTLAPGVIPVETYKPRIEQAASDSLGREVTIGDDLSLKILPKTAFNVKNLTIANADGFDGDYLATVEEADIGVKLLNLLTGGGVEVDRFVLTKPEITLARTASGAVNWNIAGAQTETIENGAGEPESAENEAPASPGEIAQPRDVKLGDVRIVDGVIRYRDDQAGASYLADNVDIAVVLNSLTEPLQVDGSMVFQGQQTRIEMVLTNLSDLINQSPANLKFDATIGEATAGADLSIVSGESLSYAGPITLAAPDLPAFASLAGVALEDAPGFDSLSASGVVEGGPDALRLEDATINFDDIDAEGLLRLDWSGAKPKAGGVLSTNRLDLRRYMPPPTQSEGFPQWSDAKLDFTSLRNVDADFDISADEIFFNGMKIDESRLKLRIENGRMVADIPELTMYGGQGSGQLVVNARSATPSLSGSIDMNSVQAQPLSLDLMKMDNLLGLGSLKLNFTASGDSQAAIMRTIDGAGGFDLADGALKGVNIAKIARAVSEFQDGFNPAALQSAVAAARGPNEQTDFSQFLSEFSIANGLVNTPTISLNGPFVTMTGNGVINLPNQTIDLSLAPRATTTADGTGGRTISIPLKVGGTFAQPAFSIDAEQLVRGAAQNQLRGLVDRIGGNNNDEEGGEQTEPEDPASQLLRGILNRPNPNNDDSDASNEASAEESLANDALGAIFGRNTKQDDDADNE